MTLSAESSQLPWALGNIVQQVHGISIWGTVLSILVLVVLVRRARDEQRHTTIPKFGNSSYDRRSRARPSSPVSPSTCKRVLGGWITGAGARYTAEDLRVNQTTPCCDSKRHYAGDDIVVQCGLSLSLSSDLGCVVAYSFQFFTFDLISELTFGESFKCQENGRFHPWILMVTQSIKFRAIIQALGYYPLLFKLFMGLIPKSYQEAFRDHQKLTSENVQRRIDKKVDYTDLASNLIDPKHNLERYEIDGNCAVLIVAGSETTTTALSATMYYLTQNPEAKAKVIKEVRSSFSSAEEITAISVNQLKYLPACFNEAMRKLPPAPAVFTRRVPREGAYIAGNCIPGGTHVGMCHFATNNSSLNFKDPEKYIPERWLGDPEYEDDARAAMQVFSVGPRNCIGQNLARLELRLLLSRVIWEFDWELDSASMDWDKDMPVYLSWGMKPLKFHFAPVVR
ncbi:unnamed protein product [Aspergillus oryzae var. brunneus]|uniref:Unnamed protein product n=1 Tax=Aspergillus oryzae var. brunneus TaxID=332754 RepID=A0ABQ6LA74_ASPOZ|nr:unnamed protein product [Aspergillus oryzae var. brunneus]